MTINYARETVIDFTKPFMNLGISILFKAPKDPATEVSLVEEMYITRVPVAQGQSFRLLFRRSGGQEVKSHLESLIESMFLSNRLQH